MISAILLAAGQSKRMNGENKLTKKIQDISLIDHSIKNILSSSIDELIIVLGYQNEIIEKNLYKHEKIKIVFNENFKSGIASSIKKGISALSKETEAFFICLGDMPKVDKNIYNELIKHIEKYEIVVPTYKNEQGNPVLFSRSLIDKISSIKGDFGAKKLIKTYNGKILYKEINDDAIMLDYNTKDNFNR